VKGGAGDCGKQRERIYRMKDAENQSVPPSHVTNLYSSFSVLFNPNGRRDGRFTTS
jgi:hypothetical protein